jgi:ribosome biogenesis GTPase A
MWHPVHMHKAYTNMRTRLASCNMIVEIRDARISFDVLLFG